MMMMCRCRTSASKTVMHQSAKVMMRFSTGTSNVVLMTRRTFSVVSSGAGPQHVFPSVDDHNCHHHHHHHQRSCGCCRRRLMSSNSSMEPDWVRSAIQKMILDQESENGSEATTPPSPKSSLSLERTPNTSTINGSAIFDSPDLEKTLQSLQNQLLEAELCIQDCYECAQDKQNPAASTSDMLQKEIDAADHSIDMAVAHFVDLLDAKQQQQQQQQQTSTNGTGGSQGHVSSSRSTNHPGHEQLRDQIPTEDLVKRIKQLRAEIAKLKLVQQQSIVTTTTMEK